MHDLQCYDTVVDLSPYDARPVESFWRTAVAERASLSDGLYRPRFPLTGDTRIAIAGDCFAQELARELRSSAATVLDCEPPPPGLPDSVATKFGYRLFSARYGNLYFARQLRQLIDEAYGRRTPQDYVWQRGDRYFDALRPSVEPDGLSSPDEVVAHRRRHLVAVREMFASTDVFVYVFSLNEAWVHAPSETVYPTAPSTVAGRYDPAVHRWNAFDYAEVVTDFSAVVAMLREINPAMRILTMLSPVPGTATITDQHVLAANTRNKAILRAAAAALSDEFDFVDYFPAYELVATPFSRERHYDFNCRTVSLGGLAAVMQMLLDAHTDLRTVPREPQVAPQAQPSTREHAFQEDEDVCEDLLLDAFAR